MDLVRQLWERVNRRAPFKWSVGPKTQKSLRALLPSLSDDFFNGDKEDLNRRLRPALSNAFQSGDAEAANLASWVVRKWGGISQLKEESLTAWLTVLGDFSSNRVASFIEINGTNRISSWSKILAFVDYKNHAVYDSRTSVALNCALQTLQYPDRFAMPESRNKVVAPARKRLMAQPDIGRQLGYLEYLEFLRAVVACDLANSLLDAEMVLFQNAKVVAAKYLNPEE